MNRAAPPATEDGVQFVAAARPAGHRCLVRRHPDLRANGRPQAWVNVLGRVTDPDGISSLTYSLNGGPEQILSMGENTVRLVARRLQRRTRLRQPHRRANTVRVKAVDRLGDVTLRTVTVNYVAGVTAPANFSIDWSTA